MPFTINIPKATDFISQSQPLIEQNFNELQTWASVDHSPLASAVGLEGFHYKTTFVPQNPPLFGAIPTFPNNYQGLFCANPANVGALPAVQPLTGLNELFLNKNTGLNTFETFPITASLVVNGSVPSEGFFYLPGGLLVKYGTTNVALGPNPQIYTYIVNPSRPVFNVAFRPIVFLQPITAALPIVTNIISGAGNNNLQFTYQAYLSNTGTQVGGFPIYWLAIGVV